MEMKKTWPSLLIFDMDGLLIDSERMYRKAWFVVAKQRGIALDEAHFAAWNGQSLPKTMAKLAELLGSKQLVEELNHEREGYIVEQVQSNAIQAKPYAKEVLEEAKRKNLLVALATSTKKSRAELILHNLGLLDYFDGRTYGDEVSNLKPDPEVYTTMLTKMHHSAEQAIALEDSIVGATAASRAGLAVIRIPDSSNEQEIRASETGLNICLKGTSLEVVEHWLHQFPEH